MTASQADSARHFYDRISGVYDALADASEHEARELGLRLLAPSGSERVLEVGFGTGHALVEIAQRLAPDGRVFGIDVSQGMLDVAERRVQAANLGDRIAELRSGDARELPYDAGSFDAVFFSFTLELFSEADIPRVLAEVFRVLRPEGRLGVVAMHDEGGKSAIVDLYRFLHRHFPHIVDCQPIDVCSHLERAGFEVIASESVSIWGLPVLATVGRLRGSARDRDRGRSSRRRSARSGDLRRPRGGDRRGGAGVAHGAPCLDRGRGPGRGTRAPRRGLSALEISRGSRSIPAAAAPADPRRSGSASPPGGPRWRLNDG